MAQAVKNIVILSDGTGNAASSVWRTNVWRLFQALNLQGNDQVAKYDDGVGTSAFVPLAFFGGAFGWGLKRNILDAYKFVCRNYQAGDHIFLFGFSRGAFTVRVIAAFILDQGLVQASSEGELHDQARKAYRAYRAHGYQSKLRIEKPLRAIRDWGTRIRDRLTKRRSYAHVTKVPVPTIEFIGVWDTVAAYGLPADEMTRGFSNYIWPLELPDRDLNPRVNYARHALALDDERTTFHPVLWNEPQKQMLADEGKPLSDRRLLQVWFPGMHANVGGGYPDDALALVPYLWILTEAKKRQLIVKTEPDDDPDAVKIAQSAEDKDGRLYDSRAGLGGYYRYGPRKVFDLCNDPDHGVRIAVPKLHESVFGRIDSGCNAYAPIGLPANYVVITNTGQILPPGPNQYETVQQATAREAAQERVWNYVWMRRIVYFLTLAATIHLVAFWLFHPQNAKHEFESRIRLVSEMVRLVESALPQAFHWWTNWYAGNPEWFAGGVVVAAIFTALGSSLSAKISDLMRIVWRSKGADSPVPNNALHRLIFDVRRSPAYQRTIWLIRMHILPVLFVLALAWGVLTLTSHFLFNVADSMGAFCEGVGEKANPVNLGIHQPGLEFRTDALCAPTGLTVRRGRRYEIKVEVTETWRDDTVTTTPRGFYSSSPQVTWHGFMYAAVPLRRVIFRPCFRLIARVGETGVDEYFLDPINRVTVKTDPDPKKVSTMPTNIYVATFQADRDGEVFLYVNDASLAFPWFHSIFYGNNHGKATISVKVL